ncbi:MAG: hypothetical protein ACO1NZ_04170 [Adhaeribacter sp.]
MRIRVTAIFLLFVLLRVLLPDSLILALHRHTHTTENHLDHHLGEEQVDVQHIHCETDHLFHNSFYVLPQTLSWLVFPSHPSVYPGHFAAVWKFTFPNNTLLRGPPALRK